jgi:hypothetical protein
VGQVDEQLGIPARVARPLSIEREAIPRLFALAPVQPGLLAVSSATETDVRDVVVVEVDEGR